MTHHQLHPPANDMLDGSRVARLYNCPDWGARRCNLRRFRYRRGVWGIPVHHRLNFDY